MGAQGQAEAAAGVRRAAGAVVAEGIDARGRAGRLCLDEGAAAGAQVPVVRGHSVQQPVDTVREVRSEEAKVCHHPQELALGSWQSGRGGWAGLCAKASVR